jgi:hypothetical protein
MADIMPENEKMNTPDSNEQDMGWTHQEFRNSSEAHGPSADKQSEDDQAEILT